MKMSEMTSLSPCMTFHSLRAFEGTGGTPVTLKSMCFVFFMLMTLITFPQSVVISSDESTPDASSILDVQSDSKGMLVPRMTAADRMGITNPAEGLIVYQIDDVKGFYYYTGSEWTAFVNVNQITDFGSGDIITENERKVVAKVDTLSLVPPGTVVPFAGPTANIPAGWLLCDGRDYQKSTYPNLYEAIGGSWGESNSAFFVPDLRGYFLRGVDGGVNVDPNAASRTNKAGTVELGNVVGSYQEDKTKLPDEGWDVSNSGSFSSTFTSTGDGAHSHYLVSGVASTDKDWTVNRENHFAVHGPDVNTSNLDQYFLKATSVNPSAFRSSEEPDHNHDVTVSIPDHSHAVSGGDEETRPKNAYVNYIIKY